MSRKPSVALIGMRGSGKTAVGRELALLLGLPHVDTDDLVVRTVGRSISEIFASEGEIGFRDRERRAVAEAVARSPAVISVGGGAILDPGNVAALKGVAKVVWLTAPVDILWARIERDPASVVSRPALTALIGRAELAALLATRAALYAAAADEQIDTANKSVAEVAAEVALRVA